MSLCFERHKEIYKLDEIIFSGVCSMPLQVWLLLICVATVGSNSLVLSPILSDVAHAFGSSAAEVARAAAAYGGATALSALVFGRLTDVLGGRKALTIGLAALTAGMALCAVSWRWEILALGQGLAGLGGGILLPGAYAMAAKVAPEGEEARVMGRVLTGWSVSLVAGVPTSALITDLLGWQSVFILLGAIAFLVLLCCQTLPRNGGGAVQERGLALFSLMRLPMVLPLLFICLAFMSSFYGVYAFLGDHMRVTLGLSASQAGLIVLVYGVGFGVAGVGDRLIDRYGARRLFPVILAVLSLVYIGMLLAMTSLVAMLLVSFLWGFVNHFCVNILILLLSRAGGNRRAALLGVNSAVTYLGAMIGATLFGEVYTAYSFGALAVMASVFLVAAAFVAAFVGLRIPGANSSVRP